MTDSHVAAQMAFGAPISRPSLGRIFQRVQGHVAHPRRRASHRRRRRAKFHRGRTTGIVIPKEMVKMMIFARLISDIRGASR